MNTIDIVIGANFGDEGKGLFTDYLANKYNGDCTVVRFNGGAQAGHTVVSPEGGRHVYSHFGSGSMVGAKTFLSEFFISNPVLFKKEWHQIGEPDLKVMVHPDSLITTPYDMIINQFVERKRDSSRHGSCGAGIHETIRRNEKISFTVKDINSPKIIDILYEIRQYAMHRADNLELDIQANLLMTNPLVLSQFIEDLRFFMENVEVIGYVALTHYEHVIFEGAQGLLLDQDHSYFPYVTHSKTGMINAIRIIQDLPCFLTYNYEMQVYYITRGYMTRHGVGPFPSETIDELPYDSIYDKTNIHNEWQQNLRFGYLDLDLLNETIMNDFIGSNDATLNIVATCMDQLPDDFQIISSGYNMLTSKTEFYERLKEQYGNVYISEGETRTTIKKLF